MITVHAIMQELSNNIRQILVYDEASGRFCWHSDADEIFQAILYKHSDKLSDEVLVHRMQTYNSEPPDDNT